MIALFGPRTVVIYHSSTMIVPWVAHYSEYGKNAEFCFQLIQIAPVTSGLASHILLAVEAVAFPKSLGC